MPVTFRPPHHSRLEVTEHCPGVAELLTNTIRSSNGTGDACDGIPVDIALSGVRDGNLEIYLFEAGRIRRSAPTPVADEGDLCSIR
jgi:hypothetical protein